MYEAIITHYIYRGDVSHVPSLNLTNTLRIMQPSVHKFYYIFYESNCLCRFIAASAPTEWLFEHGAALSKSLLLRTSHHGNAIRNKLNSNDVYLYLLYTFNLLTKPLIDSNII